MRTRGFENTLRERAAAASGARRPSEGFCSDALPRCLCGPGPAGLSGEWPAPIGPGPPGARDGARGPRPPVGGPGGQGRLRPVCAPRGPGRSARAELAPVPSRAVRRRLPAGVGSASSDWAGSRGSGPGDFRAGVRGAGPSSRLRSPRRGPAGEDTIVAPGPGRLSLLGCGAGGLGRRCAVAASSPPRCGGNPGHPCGPLALREARGLRLDPSVEFGGAHGRGRGWRGHFPSPSACSVLSPSDFGGKEFGS